MGKPSEENDPDIIELDLDQFREQTAKSGNFSRGSFQPFGNSPMFPDPLSVVERMLGLPSLGQSSSERLLLRNIGEIANESIEFLSALPTSITVVIQESDPIMVPGNGNSIPIFEQLRGLGLDF